MTETAPEVAVPGVVASVAGAQPARHRRPRPVPGTARGPHPALEKLFELHPALFGARFHPLKLGTFEDIMARHPGVFKKEDLKIALGQHARSTRYLECVAMGEPRHDLDGQPVEPVSAEHVFHAVMEVFRRRQGRGRGDPRPWLHQRLLALLESSGLSREAWAERMPAGDDTVAAAVQEAFAELAGRAARREALRRAYAASGKTVAEFADMYGMDPAVVQQAVQE